MLGADKSILNDIAIARVAFIGCLVNLLNASLRKDALQLSQGDYAPREFLLDNYIFLRPVKTFLR